MLVVLGGWVWGWWRVLWIVLRVRFCRVGFLWLVVCLLRVVGGVVCRRIGRFWWLSGLFFVFLVCMFRLWLWCLGVGLFLWVFWFVCSICLLLGRCSSCFLFF